MICSQTSHNKVTAIALRLLVSDIGNDGDGILRNKLTKLK